MWYLVFLLLISYSTFFNFLGFKITFEAMKTKFYSSTKLIVFLGCKDKYWL